MANKQSKGTTSRVETDEFNAFLEEFRLESDRAAVILAAAKLDSALGEILNRFFLPYPGATDDLLEGDSPLATFSSRIKICFRLGLLDSEVASSLNMIRRIRNSFAHEHSGVSLKTGAHRDRVRSLVSPVIANVHFRKILLRILSASPDESLWDDPGVQFRAFCALLALRLEGKQSGLARASSDNPTSLCPPKWYGPYTEDDSEESIKTIEASASSGPLSAEVKK